MTSALGAGQGITAGPSINKARLSASLRTSVVCGSEEPHRKQMLRLLLHGDARGLGEVIFGFKADEHQITFQRLVPQHKS